MARSEATEILTDPAKHRSSSHSPASEARTSISRTSISGWSDSSNASKELCGTELGGPRILTDTKEGEIKELRSMISEMAMRVFKLEAKLKEQEESSEVEISKKDSLIHELRLELMMRNSELADELSSRKAVQDQMLACMKQVCDLQEELSHELTFRAQQIGDHQPTAAPSTQPDVASASAVSPQVRPRSATPTLGARLGAQRPHVGDTELSPTSPLPPAPRSVQLSVAFATPTLRANLGAQHPHVVDTDVSLSSPLPPATLRARLGAHCPHVVHTDTSLKSPVPPDPRPVKVSLASPSASPQRSDRRYAKVSLSSPSPSCRDRRPLKAT
eukprot:TRINITY_DN43576_c0_g1_i1.p1 TRINITY_DN43576_c0_g1~~TRINITY_DN43576_c0_g1_i1.p1  ORF type:complete len:347 (-),score=46.01 TRINITY_DN43576_c0_g1_i1:105-1094(-)